MKYSKYLGNTIAFEYILIRIILKSVLLESVFFECFPLSPNVFDERNDCCWFVSREAYPRSVENSGGSPIEISSFKNVFRTIQIRSNNTQMENYNNKNINGYAA